MLHLVPYTYLTPSSNVPYSRLAVSTVVLVLVTLSVVSIDVATR